MPNSAPHCFKVMIFYEDTDAAGVVYHANYLKYMERARTMFLHDHDLTLATIINEEKVQLLVRGINISYEAPARLEQCLTVVTEITKLGRASMVFSQNIYGDPEQAHTRMCSAEVAIVCTDLNYKPCPLPKRILQEIKV